MFWPKYQLVVPESWNLLKSTWLVERLHRCPPRLPPRVREHPRPSLYQPLQPPPTPHSLTYILWVVTMCFTPHSWQQIFIDKNQHSPAYSLDPCSLHIWEKKYFFPERKKTKKKHVLVMTFKVNVVLFYLFGTEYNFVNLDKNDFINLSNYQSVVLEE